MQNDIYIDETTENMILDLTGRISGILENYFKSELKEYLDDLIHQIAESINCQGNVIDTLKTEIQSSKIEIMENKGLLIKINAKTEQQGTKIDQQISISNDFFEKVKTPISNISGVHEKLENFESKVTSLIEQNFRMLKLLFILGILPIILFIILLLKLYL